jgi:hypothetical protein
MSSPAQRRFYSLVLAKAGSESESQQGHGAADLAPSRSEAASAEVVLLTSKVCRFRGNFGIPESARDCCQIASMRIQQIASMRIQNDPKQPEPTVAKLLDLPNDKQPE